MMATQSEWPASTQQPEVFVSTFKRWNFPNDDPLPSDWSAWSHIQATPPYRQRRWLQVWRYLVWLLSGFGVVTIMTDLLEKYITAICTTVIVLTWSSFIVEHAQRYFLYHTDTRDEFNAAAAYATGVMAAVLCLMLSVLILPVAYQQNAPGRTARRRRFRAERRRLNKLVREHDPFMPVEDMFYDSDVDPLEAHKYFYTLGYGRYSYGEVAVVPVARMAGFVSWGRKGE
jgi:hypothetical protein